MTWENFKEGFMFLVAAKLLAPDPDFIKAKRDVYWVALRDIPDDLWFKGVEHCIKHGNYFPSVEELAEGSLGSKSDLLGNKISWESTLRREMERRTKKIEPPEPRVRLPKEAFAMLVEKVLRAE